MPGVRGDLAARRGPVRRDPAHGKVERLYRELAFGFDVVFSVGTSSVFPYIAEPVHRANRAGVPTVEINPGTSDVSDLVDVKLAMGAAEALDAIWRRYQEAVE